MECLPHHQYLAAHDQAADSMAAGKDPLNQAQLRDPIDPTPNRCRAAHHQTTNLTRCHWHRQTVPSPCREMSGREMPDQETPGHRKPAVMDFVPKHCQQSHYLCQNSRGQPDQLQKVAVLSLNQQGSNLLATPLLRLRQRGSSPNGFASPLTGRPAGRSVGASSVNG